MLLTFILIVAFCLWVRRVYLLQDEWEAKLAQIAGSFLVLTFVLQMQQTSDKPEVSERLPETSKVSEPDGLPNGLSTKLYANPQRLRNWPIPNYLINVPEDPCDTYTKTLLEGYPPFSQLGQDVILYHIFKDTSDSPYFVDLAAAFPKFISNTYYMEKCMGWEGLCIEADPRKRDALIEQRTCKVVDKCVSDKREEISVSFGAYLSGTERFDTNRKGKNKLTCERLETILSDTDAPKTIDFMSLDIEGAEGKAISSLGDYKIETILIELEKIRHENETSTIVMDFLKKNDMIPAFGFKSKFSKVKGICHKKIDEFTTIDDVFDFKWARQNPKKHADILFYKRNGRYHESINKIVSNC